MHGIRDAESSKQRDLYLADLRSREATARATETPEAREAHLGNMRSRVATGQATESQEAREARLSSLRLREASARATETPEAREARLANTRSKVAAGRATESEEARDSCLASLRSRSTDDCARGMPEATSSRRTSNQGHIRASRLSVWQDKHMAAFNYDPTIDCQISDGQVWKDGRHQMPSLQSIEMDRRDTGMCCAGRKVKLPSLGTPPEPLKSLLSGQHPRSREFLTNARKTTLRRMLQGWLQLRPLHPGTRRKDEEHCLPETIALRERSQFGLCIYFEHNNKVHNKLELRTPDDLTQASPGSFAGTL